MSQASRILIAVNGRAERRAIARYAQRLDYAPVEVATADAATQLLRDPTRDFAAAVVDIELPDSHGLALVPRLRLPPLPVATIVIGDSTLEQVAPLALALGVHRLLRKPFAPAAFASALESACKRTAEYRRWLDPETVGERHDSWIEVLLASDDENSDPRDPSSARPAFLERMARVVITRGQLSPAEARLVPDLLLGRDYASIGALQGVSAETVRSHVKAILGKLNLHSAKELWQVCVAELDR